MIDRQTIAELRGKIADEDYARLATLYHGEVEALKQYKDEPTPAALNHYNAAKSALAKLVEDLDLDDVEQANAVIGNPTDLHRWLAAEGYCAAGRDEPIKKSKVYKDRKSGLLMVDDAKAITYKEAMAYVARAQLAKSGVNRADVTEELSIQLMRGNVESVNLKNKKIKFELDRERGLYKKIEDFELELAIQTSVLDSMLRNLIRGSADEVVRLVGGDPKKAGLVFEFYSSRIDMLLDQFARMNKLNIVVPALKESCTPS